MSPAFSIRHVGNAVMVSLLMTRGQGRKQWTWFAGAAVLAVGLSVVTQGALGQALDFAEGRADLTKLQKKPAKYGQKAKKLHRKEQTVL